MKLGLYIHIPFCGEKCDYCGFHSVQICGDTVMRNESVPRFLDVMKSEIETDSAAAKDYTIDTIFFGGGTPSILEPDEIGQIIDYIRLNYSVEPDAEMTLEMNPSHMSHKIMREYAIRGINRFTLGVQMLDFDSYRFIGRKGGFVTDEILDEFASFRRASLGVDIISGIPVQGMESFLSGLRKITDRGIAHFSVYLLTLESESPFGRRTRYSDSDEILQREIFFSTISLLAEKGYNHYEISNFARKGEESRHNNKYWTWEPYLGFGPSAHSFFNDVRYSNPLYHEYLRGEKRIIDERSDRMQMAEFIMTGLRLIRGISGQRFHEIFNVSIPEEVIRSIEKEAARGNLDVQGSFSDDFNIRICHDRLFIADEVTFELVRSLL